MSKIAVIYWSGTGNTEGMAKAIAAGAGEAGATAELFEVTAAPKDLSGYDVVALGCPSMGDEVLEEADFEPYYTEVEPGLKGKKVALFGSYGWGDGQWMREWADRAGGAGLMLFDEGKICQDACDEGEMKSLGQELAKW